MTHYFSLDKITTQGDKTSIENKVIKLDVDLLALREKHPKTYLYMFLATTNAYGETVDSISFIHGDKELPKHNVEKSELALIHNIYPRGYKRPNGVSFLRPDLLILSSFVREKNKKVAVKAILGDSVLILNEPLQISEQAYFNGHYDKVDEKDQREISEEINAIYKGRIAC